MKNVFTAKEILEAFRSFITTLDVVTMLMEEHPEVSKKKFQRIIYLIKTGNLKLKMNDNLSYVLNLLLRLSVACGQRKDYCRMAMDGADNKIKTDNTFTEMDYILFCAHIKFIYEFKKCTDMGTDTDMWKMKTEDEYFDGMYQA